MSVPLYTDPAIEYLSSIAKPNWSVFEYGGGGSTAWYRSRCATVVTVEHDSNWFDQIGGDTGNHSCRMIDRAAAIEPAAIELDARYFSSGITVPTRTDRDDGFNRYHGLIDQDFRGYASYICAFPESTFDCVAVDGMARSLCLWYAAHTIKPDGFIILDNSDRLNFNSVSSWLISQGFNRRDFWQPNHPCWCTSFFSKTFSTTDLPIDRPENSGDIYVYG